jgi:hypothetical protein
MKSVSEEPNTKTKFGVTPSSGPPDPPNTPAETRAVECFATLEAAEHDFREGREFGEAANTLRDEIKATGGRNWMGRLEQLGITYEKARYWIAVVERKPTQRGNKAAKAQEPAWDWDTAAARLKALKDSIVMLKQSQPVGSGRLVGPLASLAELLGYRLVQKGGDNA